jgi:hypothetical protein
MIYTITPYQTYFASVNETVYSIIFDLTYPNWAFIRVTTNGLPTESTMILLQKGIEFQAEYASIYFPVLTSDWAGSVSFYTTYPGTAIFTKPLVLSNNKLVLSLTIAEILNLADGVYSFVTVITNSVLGITTTKLEYATVLPINASPETKCKLFGTILKSDGTPAGSETKVLTNTTTGTALVLGWNGVKVNIALPLADEYSGNIIGVEIITTDTNAAGYFEKYVIQGLTVNVTCPAFGKSVLVNTTGLASKDLSSYF